MALTPSGRRRSFRSCIWAARQRRARRQRTRLSSPARSRAWEQGRALGLECVVRVSHSDDLERALAELDPDIFLLSAEPGSDEDPLEVMLELLHDVPAGKLAIAELQDATAEDVAELERAGVDGVLVATGSVAALVATEPPDV